jgi:hypothetical protein
MPHRERLGNRLCVSPLDQPHPNPRRGQRAHVRLGTAQRRLHHGPGRWVARPQRSGDAQRGAGRAVVFRVQRHSRAHRVRCRRDLPDVLGGDPLAKRPGPGGTVGAEQQPDRGGLDRDLDRAALGQPFGGEFAEQLGVLGGGRLGLE